MIIYLLSVIPSTMSPMDQEVNALVSSSPSPWEVKKEASSPLEALIIRLLPFIYAFMCLSLISVS